MDTLKATFEDERQHLEGRIKQLQSQLQQVQGTQHDDIIKLDQMSKSQRDSQRKAQYDLDEVKHEKEMLKRKLDAVSSYFTMNIMQLKFGSAADIAMHVLRNSYIHLRFHLGIENVVYRWIVIHAQITS